MNHLFLISLILFLFSLKALTQNENIERESNDYILKQDEPNQKTDESESTTQAIIFTSSSESPTQTTTTTTTMTSEEIETQSVTSTDRTLNSTIATTILSVTSESTATEEMITTTKTTVTTETTINTTSTTSPTTTTTEAIPEYLIAPNYKLKVKKYSKDNWLDATLFLLIGLIVAIVAVITHYYFDNREKIKKMSTSSRYMTDKKYKIKKDTNEPEKSESSPQLQN